MRSTVSNGRKLRVAWFSPLPGGTTPVGSKAAYASELLLPWLRQGFELELFHDEFRSYQDYPTHHCLSAFERHAQQPFDLFFYQLEDLPCTNFSRAHLGLIPGVVWFHDLLFTTRSPEGLLHSPWEVTLQKFLGRDIEWPAEELWPDVSSPIDRRCASLALLPIFSNPWAHSEYLRCIDQSFAQVTNLRPSSFYLPIPADPLPDCAASDDRFTVGFSGTPRIESRAHILLQAIAEAKHRPHLLWLLDEAERPHAQELCNEFGTESVEFITERSPQNWRKALPRIDLAIHTLFSVFGSTAPYLSLSLLAKIPVVTTRFGAAELLPPQATIQLEPGDSEVTQLRTVIEDQLHHRGPNKVGYRYASETFLSHHVAAELNALLTQAAAPLQDALARWAAVESDAKAALLNTVTDGRLRKLGGAPPSLADDPLLHALNELGWRR